MRARATALGAALLALGGCKAIPLNEDPNTAAADRRASPASLYEVEWWTPLVKTGLLEYQPSEPASPAVDPDTERVIVGTRDGFLRCLSPEDGHVEWEAHLGGRFVGGPTVLDGVVYSASGDGHVTALRVLTGEKLWDYDAGEELVTQPVVAEGRVLVTSQSETVFAVDAQQGKWVWQYRRDAPSGFTIRGAARPTVWKALVLTGFADGYLVALGLSDGVLRWEQKLSGRGHQFLDVDSSPVVDEHGHAYAASYQDGVAAVDAKTGELLWSSARQGVTSLLLRGAVLFTTGDGTLSALDTRDGKALWGLDLSDRGPKGKGNNAGMGPMLARGLVVVPTSTSLAFVDASAGRVRAAWNPGRGVTATPVRFSGPRHGARLYVLTNLGTVFALQLTGAGG